MSHFTTLVSLTPPDDFSNCGLYTELCIEETMAPFCESAEEPEYLAFEDKTDEVTREYTEDTVNCFVLPNGKIAPENRRLAHLFAIKDGMVYQRAAGPLKHDMRTKKAKKMRALPSYPLKKLYKTLDEFVESCYGYPYYESTQRYGYFYNPNAVWDWYLIGGRWPFVFLVKVDCPSIVEGERSWASRDDSCDAPDGYRWVAGARKKDVEWDLMKVLAIKSEEQRFINCVEAFEKERKSDNPLIVITERGIESWGDLLYEKGETLERFLERNALAPGCKYPITAFSFIEDGEYVSQGDMGWFGYCSNNKPDDEWRQTLQDFIDHIPDENLIVMVDCHI